MPVSPRSLATMPIQQTDPARTNATLVEIIPGKGTGKLKRRVLALLRQGHLRRLYRRVETDETNGGRVLVHFS
jgi:hypothetical protein